MPKLSTGGIRDLIRQWFSTPEATKHLEEEFKDSAEHGGMLDDDMIASPRPQGFGPKAKRRAGESDPDYFTRIQKMYLETWRDGKQWKRVNKELVKDDECGWFIMGYDLSTGAPTEPEFMVDYLGAFDKDLVARASSDPEFKSECWWRTFEPDNMLGDNFRLEVVTTPDDDAVVGWTVIVD